MTIIQPGVSSHSSLSDVTGSNHHQDENNVNTLVEAMMYG
jgi:hypothetical protein